MAMIRIPGLLLVIIFEFWTKLSALPASSGRGSHFALDIDSCTCTPLTTICEVTISSSVLQENHCPEKSHFCCTTKKSQISKETSETSGRSNNYVNSSSNITSNPRIKIVVPTTIAPQTAVTVELERPKPRCRCKARTKCPEKYTDYSFGFHCSHDKVRCCDPDDGFNTTEITPTSVKTSGLVINVSAPAADDETDKDKNNDCRCLPELRCNIPPDQISKRKDTSCPADLIQCCGHLILDAEKKSDEDLMTDTHDDDDDDNGQPIEKISKGFAQQSTPPLSGALQEGHSAHHQPVQIPLMKIPANSEAGPIMTATTTLPPPQLPTQYYYQTPAPQYQHRYLYAPAAPRVQTPSYYITGDPGSHRYSDTFLVNHNGRGFKVAPQRSTSTGSILGSIASMLG